MLRPAYNRAQTTISYETLKDFCSKEQLGMPKLPNPEVLGSTFSGLGEVQKQELWECFWTRIHDKGYFPGVFMFGVKKQDTLDTVLAQIISPAPEECKRLLEEKLNPKPDLKTLAGMHNTWIAMLLVLALAPKVSKEELLVHVEQLREVCPGNLKMRDIIAAGYEHPSEQGREYAPDEYPSQLVYLQGIGLDTFRDEIKGYCKDLELTEDLTKWLKSTRPGLSPI